MNVNDLTTYDPSYINRFRSADTETGSLRSHAHRWTGADAIVHAVDTLILGEKVDLHICDHHLYGNKTHIVLALSVGKSNTPGDHPYVVHAQSNVLSGCCRLCAAKPVEMSAHIACWLMSHTKGNQGIYLQPSAAMRELLDAAATI